MAFDSDDAVMGVYDLLDNSKSDTCTLGAFPLVQALEYLKYLVRKLRIKADTIILENDPAILPLRVGFSCEGLLIHPFSLDMNLRVLRIL